jgi:hypothetical protein
MLERRTLERRHDEHRALGASEHASDWIGTIDAVGRGRGEEHDVGVEASCLGEHRVTLLAEYRVDEHALLREVMPDMRPSRPAWLRGSSGGRRRAVARGRACVQGAGG